LPYTNIHVSNIVAFSPALTGRGYEVVGSDGGVFSFGSADFYGSIPSYGAHASTIVGITTSIEGYYLVGSNGGVYAFGDCQFRGSLASTPLPVPIVGLIPTGDGYEIINAAGGSIKFLS